jgi:hypothetical protein
MKVEALKTGIEQDSGWGIVFQQDSVAKFR